jgi:acyl-CoA synthetase (AMP-forming)/AMP-acid ligase II/acyl carrier protein
MRPDHLLPMRARRHADERPDEHALSFLDDRQEVVDSLTYRQLDQRAHSVAAQLLDRELAGTPIVLSFPPGLDFITTLFGCMYAGAIAVPATLPGSRRADERLAAIIHDAGARCVLASAEHRADLQRVSSGCTASVDVIATEQICSVTDGGFMVEPAAGQLAFLQYTSGSTRAPRGVMVRHTDLAANLACLSDIIATDRESVGVSWLPLFHDLGLIAGVLLPLWQGFPTYLMAPGTFVQNPLSWLAAISRYRGTHGYAPNFAYEACVEAARASDADELDLTTWRVALSGAEPVRADTLDRFRAQFAANGFRPESLAPGYGLAEATLAVSGGDGSKPAVELTVDESELHIGQVRPRIDGGPGAKRLVASGRPGTDIEVQIVRPDVCRAAEPSALGEIWVRSTSVAQGYWCKPAETAETFGARMATGEGPYLRTGDLGFLHDGDLFVIGRLKDVIVIRGANFYPHDIEGTVEASHPALQTAGCAVVEVDIAGQVGLAAFQEIRRDYADSIEGNEVVDAIRRAVAREHQLPLQRVILLHPRGLPKTSSGKVQRAKCRDPLAAAGLPVLHEWQFSSAGAAPIDVDTESLSQPGVLERQLTRWLKRELSLTDLTWQTPLGELGIDSLKGVEMVNALSVAFDHTFPATSMIDHPTIASLAELIRTTLLGNIGQRGGSSRDVYTAEQIDALDERELAAALQQRINDVLDRGR